MRLRVVELILSIVLLTIFFVCALVVGGCSLVAAPTDISGNLTGAQLARYFDVTIVSAKFKQVTPSLSNMFNSTVQLAPVGPNNALPVVVSVKPKPSFTGEPFLTRTIGGQVVVQSQPDVYMLLCSKDGYVFSHQLLTWTPDELRPVDTSSIRDNSYLQAVENKSVKSVTFWVSGSDKDVVALQQDLENYFTKAESDAVKSFLDMNWGGSASAQVQKINSDTLGIVSRYFKVRFASREEMWSNPSW
jgi:hypothetical protein